MTRAPMRFDGQSLMLAVERGKKWAERAAGTWSGFQFGKELGLESADLVNQVLDELLHLGRIERAGDRYNWFRSVSGALVEMDWLNASEEPYPLAMPLGLNEQAIISPGNVVVVAGETNAGKTAFVLNLIAANLRAGGGAHDEVSLFNSEMGPTEMRARLLNMRPVEHWSGLKVYSRSRDFHQVLRPDGLNVLDYLENLDDFYLVGKRIEEIHNALGHGVAVVCLQKKKGADYARGGEFSLEKARLGVSLSYDGFVNTCKITKCKAPAGWTNPDGKERDFRIERGASFTTLTPWEYVTPDERKRRTSAYRLEERRRELAAQRASEGFDYADI